MNNGDIGTEKMNSYKDWSESLYNAIQYKIDILVKTTNNEFLRKKLNQIELRVRNEQKNISDKTDFITFKSKGINLLRRLSVLLQTTKLPSQWAHSLLKDCYIKTGIDTNQREILIAQSPENMSLDSSEGFGIYINFFREIDAFFHIKQQENEKIFDIYVLPNEIKYDFTSLPIFGHEIGHILCSKYIQLINPIIIKNINSDSKIRSILEMGTNSALYQQSEIVKRIFSITQEYFCDEIGASLFGLAFDLANSRLLAMQQSNKGQNKHPPNEFRANKSLSRIRAYANKSEIFSRFLNQFLMDCTIEDSFQFQEKEFVEKAVEEIITAIKENYNILNTDVNISIIWEKISKELNCFRPPIEVIDTERIQFNTPIEMVIGSIIYNYNIDNIEKCNEYYNNSNDKAYDKLKFIRNIINEHLIYSLNLSEFASSINTRYPFDKEKLPELWSWRLRKAGGKENPLIILPSLYPNSQYSQNAVDIRLGCYFLVHKPTRYTHLSPYPDKNQKEIDYYEEVYVPPMGEFIIHPHQFILASTLEYICLPFDYYALILGRSSWGRLGLNIATATTIQAGYRGCITLELRNLGESPIKMKTGSRIAQLCLIKTPTEITKSSYFTAIFSKYVGSTKVEKTKILKDIDIQMFSDFGEEC